MKVLVVYDISSDSLRLRIAEILKDFGLRRIQRSAFIGELTGEERKDLEKVLSRLRLDPSDRIDLFPICERDLKLHTWISSEGVVRGEGR